MKHIVAAIMMFTVVADAEAGTLFFNKNNTPPVIVAEPQDVSIKNHGVAIMSVSISNTHAGKVAYKWYKDGVLLDVDGPVMLLDEVGDTGNYYVVVSTSAGSVTSRTAKVSIVEDKLLPGQARLVKAGKVIDISKSVNGTVYNLGVVGKNDILEVDRTGVGPAGQTMTWKYNATKTISSGNSLVTKLDFGALADKKPGTYTIMSVSAQGRSYSTHFVVSAFE